MTQSRPAAPAAPPLRPRPGTVGDVVDLVQRYAEADRELADALELIGGEVSSSRRVSQATVSRLVRLLDGSLLPGMRAKAELDALPRGLRRAGVAAWARQATTGVAGGSVGGAA